MGLIEIASGDSVWRGMDYYENHKVVSWSCIRKQRGKLKSLH